MGREIPKRIKKRALAQYLRKITMNSYSEFLITLVEFPEPVNGRTIYYFGSLAAIYEYFDHSVIGIRLSTLHHRNIGTEPYDTGKCKISKQIAYRLKRPRKNE